MGYLRERFHDWFRRAAAHGQCAAFYREIVEGYSVPQRFYHTFGGHVAFCLHELERVPVEMIANREALEFSLILHDVVMEFMSDCNEERSARFAIDLCGRMGLSEDFVALCAMHIRSTDHKGVPKNADSCLVIDIDLAILGQPEDAFDAYERGIRKEYAFVPEESFRTGRARILRRFLDRPSIFLTGCFRDRYETKARKNLMRSIAELER